MRPGFDELSEAFAKDALLTIGVLTKALAHGQVPAHSIFTPGPIGDAPFIVTMDAMSGGLTSGASRSHLVGRQPQRDVGCQGVNLPIFQLNIGGEHQQTGQEIHRLFLGMVETAHPKLSVESEVSGEATDLIQISAADLNPKLPKLGITKNMQEPIMVLCLIW